MTFLRKHKIYLHYSILFKIFVNNVLQMLICKLNFHKHSQNKMSTISLKFYRFILFLHTLQLFKINIAIQIKVFEKYFSLFNNVKNHKNSKYNHCLSLQLYFAIKSIEIFLVICQFLRGQKFFLRNL